MPDGVINTWLMKTLIVGFVIQVGALLLGIWVSIRGQNEVLLVFTWPVVGGGVFITILLIGCRDNISKPKTIIGLWVDNFIWICRGRWQVHNILRVYCCLLWENLIVVLGRTVGRNWGLIFAIFGNILGERTSSCRV